MSQIHIVQVRYEWTKEFTIRGGTEEEAEAQAVALAKDELQDEMEAAAPSTDDFETYVL